MRQILHIFKKDVGHHWLEVLASFALLGLYLAVTLRNPNQSLMVTSFSWFWLSADSVPPLMILFWVFITVRLVQGEPLVGDRQWWVTKPYEWWKLLAAKELFLLAFIALPLFLVQLYLLHQASFPVLSNILRVLQMQLTLGLILFLPSVALGSLTRTLWQAVVTVFLALVALASVFDLLEKVPNSSMSSAVDDLGETIGLLILASVLGAIGWQYARRRTWASRAVLVSGPVLAILLSALIPYARFVERKYPVAQGNEAPASFAIEPPNPIARPPKKQKNQSDLPSEVSLTFPVLVSGISPGHVVQIEGVRVYADTPGLPPLDPGWWRQWITLWPEYQRTAPTYPIKRKDFESLKAKPLRLRLELTLIEYQETEPRDLILEDGRFRDEKLGICQLPERFPSVIACRRPFRYPSLMATFDPSTSHCEALEDEVRVPEDHVSHAWLPYGESFASGVLSPMEDYNISFWSPPRWDPIAAAQRKVRTPQLCPGAKVRLAKPQEEKHVRVKLQLDSVRLEDLVTSESDLD